MDDLLMIKSRISSAPPSGSVLDGQWITFMLTIAPGFCSSLEVAPVDGFFLQIREETLTPGVVRRSADSGKALQDSVLLERFGDRLRCKLASTVTMMDTAGQQRPAMKGFCESPFKIYLHVVSHCVGENKTRYHVFDRAEILKALSSPYVANIITWNGLVISRF